MADAPIPVEAAPPADGDLFTSYNPEGAAGGLFAPAYIHGFAPAENAVAKWSAGHGGNLTHDMITGELRMPDEWAPPQPQQMSRGDGVYGGQSIPLNLTLGKDPHGKIDVAALRAMSHGTAYDVQGRRDAISARLLANKTAEDDYNRRQPSGPPMERGQEYSDWWNEEQKRQQKVFMDTQFNAYY